jgi:putative transposase
MQRNAVIPVVSAGRACRKTTEEQAAKPITGLSDAECKTQSGWALDLVADRLQTGRGFRVPTIVDAFTRECLALDVDTSLGSRRVAPALERIMDRSGTPSAIRCDRN